MLSALGELEPQFRRARSKQQLLVEMLLVRFALFDARSSIEDVLQGLSGVAEPARQRNRGALRNTPRAEQRARANASARPGVRRSW
jgi:hypothetical protein